MTNTLILTVGLPYSGKTTWALQQGHPIVQPDAIRLALHGERYVQAAEPMVWAMARYMVRALFLAGHNTVVLDATNTTAARRAEWLDQMWGIRLHVIRTTAEECVERALAVDDHEIIPVIRRMAVSMEWPTTGDQP